MAELPPERRRASDKIPLDIESMIINESDPNQRAFLIVLNSINLSLIANTSTVKAVSEKLELHLENFAQHTAGEAAIMNKGRGMWTVTAWVLGLAQAVGVGLWIQVRGEFANISDTLQSQSSANAVQDSRLKNLESKL